MRKVYAFNEALLFYLYKFSLTIFLVIFRNNSLKRNSNWIKIRVHYILIRSLNF